MNKELKLEMEKIEKVILNSAKASAKELDKVIMTKLEKIENKFVGWRFSKPEPFIQTTDMYISELQTSCDMSIQLIGFDNEKDFVKYLNEGFYVYDKEYLQYLDCFETDNILRFNEVSKEDIKKIERSSVLYFNSDSNISYSLKNEEIISSIELDDYMSNYLNDKSNCLQEKIIMSNFLNDYLDKGLYVVEFIKDGYLYLRVENEDDEILSKEFLLGGLSMSKRGFNMSIDELNDYLNENFSMYLLDKKRQTVEEVVADYKKGLQNKELKEDDGSWIKIIEELEKYKGRYTYYAVDQISCIWGQGFVVTDKHNNYIAFIRTI